MGWGDTPYFDVFLRGMGGGVDAGKGGGVGRG